MVPIAQRIADELHVRVPQVEAAIALLDDKATVPFIARYRKEATGGLDDTQLRALEERLTYLRELEERRAAILESIESRASSRRSSPRRSTPPTPRRGSKISICPTSRSGGPRRRSRAKPGSSRSRCALLQDPQLVPEAGGGRLRRRRRRASPTPPRRSKARAGS